MLYWVNQSIHWNEERPGQFIWSRDPAKSHSVGHKLTPYIRKGDFILHDANGYLRAIGIAQGNSYKRTYPNSDASEKGYCVRMEYYDLTKPLSNKRLIEWGKGHHSSGNPFTQKGTLEQRYLSQPTHEDGVHILRLLLSEEENPEVKNVLYAALDSLGGDDEYDGNDKIAFDEFCMEVTGGQKVTPETRRTIKERAKRSKEIRIKGLDQANYKCECDGNHKTFLRKCDDFNYTELHHLIPISRYADFDGKNLDVLANVVSLCPNCHALLHHGSMEAKRPVLKKLYDARKDELAKQGLDLTFEELLTFYE